MKIQKKDAILLAVTIILLFACIVVILMILLISYNSKQALDISPQQSLNEQQGLISPEFKYFSVLTGKGVSTEAEIMPRVVAVMINNNPDGYPVAGLNEASVVYEAPVEGSFTRFMAIYPADQGNLLQVGPVRSARPYYLDWLREYGDALYMHCGGSSDALDAIKKQNIFDADEFSKTPYYWRDRSLIAPHNLFTSSERWQKYFNDYADNRDFPKWEGWLFGELSGSSTDNNLGISYAYGKNFIIGWNYDSEKNIYFRTINGENFLDNNNESITTDNVIIQFSAIKVLDDIGRRSIVSIGEGEVRVLRDGLITRGTWKKENSSDRTRFFDVMGDEIGLKPGRIWVMIVPKNASLNIAG